MSFNPKNLIIIGDGKNYKEKIYYDAGELVREIAFVDSTLGSTDFIYRRYP